MTGNPLTSVTLLISKVPLRLRIREDLLDAPMALYRVPPEPAGPRPVFELTVTDDLPPVPNGGESAPPVCLDGERVWLRSAHYEGCLDWSSRSGVFRQNPGTRFHRVPLQVILVRELLEKDALLVHGCGLAAPAGGLLFAGPSGAGKSTVAALAGWPVLSDELCAVGLGPEREAWIAGTPLGLSSDNRSLPLAELYWLEQAPEDRLLPMGAAEAARRLLGQTVTGGFDDDAMGRALGLVAELVARRTAHRLRFTLGRSFLDLVGGESA